MALNCSNDKSMAGNGTGSGQEQSVTAGAEELYLNLVDLQQYSNENIAWHQIT